MIVCAKCGEKFVDKPKTHSIQARGPNGELFALIGYFHEGCLKGLNDAERAALVIAVHTQKRSEG